MPSANKPAASSYGFAAALAAPDGGMERIRKGEVKALGFQDA